jgi:hypothetical protein
MIKSKTQRGFALYEFKDSYNVPCSLQKSSSAEDDKIWLGVDESNPRILASKTLQGGTGWVPYPVPENVLMNTRMHLTRDQVKELLPILKEFVKTGEI